MCCNTLQHTAAYYSTLQHAHWRNFTRQSCCVATVIFKLCRALLIVYTALLSIYRALLSVRKAFSSVYMALLSWTHKLIISWMDLCIAQVSFKLCCLGNWAMRPLLSVYRALLSVHNALLSVYRALLNWTQRRIIGEAIFEKVFRCSHSQKSAVEAFNIRNWAARWFLKNSSGCRYA